MMQLHRDKGKSLVEPIQVNAPGSGRLVANPDITSEIRALDGQNRQIQL
jgi:hypothetical protein